MMDSVAPPRSWRPARSSRHQRRARTLQRFRAMANPPPGLAEDTFSSSIMLPTYIPAVPYDSMCFEGFLQQHCFSEQNSARMVGRGSTHIIPCGAGQSVADGGRSSSFEHEIPDESGGEIFLVDGFADSVMGAAKESPSTSFMEQSSPYALQLIANCVLQVAEAIRSVGIVEDYVEMPCVSYSCSSICESTSCFQATRRSFPRRRLATNNFQSPRSRGSSLCIAPVVPDGGPRPNNTISPLEYEQLVTLVVDYVVEQDESDREYSEKKWWSHVGPECEFTILGDVRRLRISRRRILSAAGGT